MKKLSLLLTACVLFSGLIGCNADKSKTLSESGVQSQTELSETADSEIKEAVSETHTSVETKEIPARTDNQEVIDPLEAELDSPAWQEYFDESAAMNWIDKFLFTDINHDGISEMISITDSITVLAYCHNDTIKELRSQHYWGTIEGGMPFYYNKATGQIMTVTSGSAYDRYSFYDYAEGNYQLMQEFTCIEKIVPWDIDKWAKSPNLDYELEFYDVSYEELKNLDDGTLLEIAWVIGYYDRVNQYTADDIEITEEQWQKTIDEFKDAPDCITLCTRNADLQFIDIDIEGRITANYLKEKLFNK